ncbi:hypothetical protein VNI00_017532 [Paramarasmius palmivorus]|uniref:Uncharacterized protein n=1 Tax=Paramarasmius palmivorus TaxID=297713 RepID=A0AAW0B4Y8_9AGAR
MEAVARWPQLPQYSVGFEGGFRSIVSTMTKTDDGRIRLELNLRALESRYKQTGGDFINYTVTPSSSHKIWLSQSPKIFNELNVTDPEEERYSTFEPIYDVRIEPRTRSGRRKQRISKDTFERIRGVGIKPRAN